MSPRLFCYRGSRSSSEDESNERQEAKQRCLANEAHKINNQSSPPRTATICPPSTTSRPMSSSYRSVEHHNNSSTSPAPPPHEPVIYAVAVESNSLDIARQRRMSAVRDYSSITRTPLLSTGSMSQLTSRRISFSVVPPSSQASFRVVRLNDPPAATAASPTPPAGNGSHSSRPDLKVITSQLSGPTPINLNSSHQQQHNNSSAGTSAERERRTSQSESSKRTSFSMPISTTSSFRFPAEDLASESLSMGSCSRSSRVPCFTTPLGDEDPVSSRSLCPSSPKKSIEREVSISLVENRGVFNSSRTDRNTSRQHPALRMAELDSPPSTPHQSIVVSSPTFAAKTADSAMLQNNFFYQKVTGNAQHPAGRSVGNKGSKGSREARSGKRASTGVGSLNIPPTKSPTFGQFSKGIAA